MNENLQFAVSCHILVILAASPNVPVTSEDIAASVKTNPVVIRRIMSHLREHGLVDSRPGSCGGWRLVKISSTLSLREVYQACSHEVILAIHQNTNPDCPIGCNIQNSLKVVFDNARDALEMALDQVSVADLLENTIQKKAQIADTES